MNKRLLIAALALLPIAASLSGCGEKTDPALETPLKVGKGGGNMDEWAAKNANNGAKGEDGGK